MPIYEYRCTGCGREFSRLQAIGAGTDAVSCPKCEHPEVERLLSAFAASSNKGASSCAAGSPPPCGRGFT